MREALDPTLDKRQKIRNIRGDDKLTDMKVTDNEEELDKAVDKFFESSGDE
jgi:hypothetical protein